MSETAVRQLTIEPIPDCDSAIAVWFGAIQDVRSRTVRALDGLASAALDWRDTCSLHTIGTLLYHIAAIEADWLFMDVLGTGFPPPIEALFPYDVRDGQGNLTIVTGMSLDDHWERLKIVRQLLLRVYQSMSVDDFRRARTLPDYQVTPEWVLHHLCQHEAEHRSELITLRARFERTDKKKGEAQ